MLPPPSANQTPNFFKLPSSPAGSSSASKPLFSRGQTKLKANPSNQKIPKRKLIPGNFHKRTGKPLLYYISTSDILHAKAPLFRPVYSVCDSTHDIVRERFWDQGSTETTNSHLIRTRDWKVVSTLRYFLCLNILPWKACQ